MFEYVRVYKNMYKYVGICQNIRKYVYEYIWRFLICAQQHLRTQCRAARPNVFFQHLRPEGKTDEPDLRLIRPPLLMQ